MQYETRMSCGLVKGHAYSVTAVEEVRTVPFLRGENSPTAMGTCVLHRPRTMHVSKTGGGGKRNYELRKQNLYLNK